MEIIIFFIKTSEFNLENYQKKIFSKNKPGRIIKKISANSKLGQIN